MRTHHHIKFLACILVAAMMSWNLLSVVGDIKSNSQIDFTKNSNIEGTNTDLTDRIVLAELFTGASCSWCASATNSIDRLSDEYGHQRLAVLECHTSTSDPLSNDDSRARANYYGVSGIPDMYFDGTVRNGGGGSSKYAKYETYKSDIETELDKLTNIIITISGDINATGGIINVHIEATDSVTETNLKVRYGLWEDDLYHLGNEIYGPRRNNRFSLRDMLPDDDLTTISNPGDSANFSKTFTIDPSWYITPDIRRIGVVVFVQSDTDKQVLQAATYDFIPQEILLVPDAGDGDTTTEEYYQNILTHERYSFDSWNVLDPSDNASYDEKGAPNSSDMSRYHAILWHTSAARSSTLSTTNQENISAYLDDIGNLFISGQDIGYDIGSTSFYTNYLHSTFVTDDAEKTRIKGVADDPISDPWSGKTIDIVGDYPSKVDPADALTNTTFNYGPGQPVSAGLRSDHDANSRVVYFAFNYFEGTDTEDTDEDDQKLINKIINWLDGAASPNVAIIQPNGGEIFDPGEKHDIRWNARDVNMSSNPIDIYYCTDYPTATWIPISTGEPNDGIYNWTLPSEQSQYCRVKIVATDSQNQSGEDIGNGNFQISRDLGVAAPTEMSAVLEGGNFQDVNITWTLSKDDEAGQKDVKNYAIYRNSSYGSNATNYIFLAEIPNGTSYYVDSGAGDGDSHCYFYYVQANDTYGNTNRSKYQAGKITKECVEGWNFISDPFLDLEGTDIITSFQTLEWDTGRWWDSTDAIDHWSCYSSFKQSEFNNLIKINRTMGIWVNVTKTGGDHFTSAGRVHDNTTVRLYKGWNFVGYASFIDRIIEETLNGIPWEQVEGFDEGATPYYLGSLASTDWMKAGNGYWIRVTTDCMWTVKN